MFRRSRVFKILKNKSGASLLFVLGAMLLLLSVGVSTLAAAGASSGFAMTQKAYSRVVILSDSIHRNIMYSLQHDPSNEDMLAYRLAYSLYEAKRDDPVDGLGAIDLQIGFDDQVFNERFESGEITVQSVRLLFPSQKVVIKPAKPAIPAIPAESGVLISREAKTATVNATMTVVVEIEAAGRIVKTIATYRYSGGELTDDPRGEHADVFDPEAEFDMEFRPGDEGRDGFGRWELVKYEKVDS